MKHANLKLSSQLTFTLIWIQICLKVLFSPWIKTKKKNKKQLNLRSGYIFVLLGKWNSGGKGETKRDFRVITYKRMYESC